MIVLTARQVCLSLQGIFTEPVTLGPSTQTCQRSSGLPSRTPLADLGSATNDLDCSPPPTTSQRYQSAPADQASLSGRNHAQVMVERSTRLSLPPRNCWNLSWH